MKTVKMREIVSRPHSLILILLAISASNVHLYSIGSTKEVKPPDAMALCGTHFTKALIYCCTRPEACGDKRTRSHNVQIGVQRANSFLASSMGYDRPVEECCQEKCTLSEVAEYCHGPII